MEKKIYKILASISIILILTTSSLLAFLYHDSSDISQPFSRVLIGISPLLVSLMVFVLIILYLLSSKLTEFIIKPMKKISGEMDLMSDNVWDYTETYDELKPIMKDMEIQKAEVKQSIKLLKENEEFRRNFTANVTHELKTPLTSINGFAEMIEYGMVKEEDIPKFAGIIKEEGTRLLSLIDSILDLSKIESLDNGQLEMDEVSLREISDRVILKLKPNFFKKNVSYTIDGDCKVMGNKSMLNDLITNLIDNGIKYNKDGGNIIISLYEDLAFGIFSIEDTGLGIPPDDLTRIFERFYMVDKSRSKNLGGSGLGLSIVKHIVESHKGKIEISSNLGQGTHIIFKIPKSNPS